MGKKHTKKEIYEKILEKCTELDCSKVNVVNMRTRVILICNEHGEYTKTPHQILYKNYRCPICVERGRRKKLSEIGKTKTGEKNNFYGKHHSKDSLEKKKQQHLKKYGVEYPSQREEIKEKIREAVLSEACLEKTKNTNIEKYGTEWANQSEEVKNKRYNTNIERYGEIAPSKNPIIKQKLSQTRNNKSQEEKDEIVIKIKQTKLLRYGDENYNNIDKIKKTTTNKYGGIGFASKRLNKKIKNTILSKYGKEYYLQTEDGINKVKQTKLKRYKDTNYNNLNKMIDTKQKNIQEIELSGYTLQNNLIKQFGQGWLAIKNTLDYKIENGFVYIKNTDIDKIIEYCEINHNAVSNIEKKILKFIKLIYKNVIIENSRGIIPPYEIDIYIPKLNLAIEFNGTYYHSIECNTPIDYHLNKSLMCREKGIRLIHIYEFENLEEQLQLLTDLILNKADNYPKDDFNKNNLLEETPGPEIIFNDKYIIYGGRKIILKKGVIL